MTCRKLCNVSEISCECPDATVARNSNSVYMYGLAHGADSMTTMGLSAHLDHDMRSCSRAAYEIQQPYPFMP